MLRRAGLVVFVSAVLASCAGMGLHESLRVNLAGLESIPGAGMEARFLAKVRVQNPNDVSITYTGLSAELDLNGKSFASGVSDATGEIPRFGESLIEIPLTVPATALVDCVPPTAPPEVLTQISLSVSGFCQNSGATSITT